MPSLSAVRASNQAWKPAFRPVVVVAGGTGGIGAGVAKAFAKYGPKDTNAPYIILVGRSRQGAEDVINEMKKHNSNGKYEFIQGDLSLMKGVRGVAAEIAGKVDEINYLCMSQGIMTMKAKDDTEEGIDRKMSLHFYSRFLLGNLLLPKLEKSADKGEEARVLSVLAAGKGGAIDLNDLGLKDSYGLKRKADSATTYNDLMIEELSIRHPKIAFTHAYPGFVDTNLAKGSYLGRAATFLMSPFSVSAEDCGEYMVYGLLRPENKTGAHFATNQGDHAIKSRYYDDKDVRSKVWQHAVEVTGLDAKS